MKQGFSRSALAVSLGAVCLAAFAVVPFSAAKDKKKKDQAPQVTAFQFIQSAPDSAWRSVESENTLLMDLPSGEIAIELRPDLAPKHVEQIKTLVRQGFYDGLKFHRVIEGFMAQGGDPEGDGTGGSDLPNIPPEFVKDSGDVDGFSVIGRDRIAARIGFVHGMPAAAEPESLRSFRTDRRVTLWPAHCPGVMSMARASAPDSANSQFFLMIGDSRENLDMRYTAWGLIVDGQENARRINRGEPPDRPTPIVRMRIASDIPEEDRPNVEVLRTETDTFQEYVEKAGFVRDGFVKDLCNIKAPRRVNGKIEL
ncbi:MAG: peptidylprolyl isomerase [Pseudomonadota bacterium]